MIAIPDSGLFISNHTVHVALIAMEEVLGKNGVHAILNLGNLMQYVDNYPPDTNDRVFDFAHFSSIMQSIEEMYGVRGGRVLSLRAGRATFIDLIPYLAVHPEVNQIKESSTSDAEKVTNILKVFANLSNAISDQDITVKETDTALIYTNDRCPACWGRKTDHNACSFSVGMVQEGVKWITGKNIPIEETACAAMGDPSCDFTILKENI
jgi:predicted hydrocarbon binding protein